MKMKLKSFLLIVPLLLCGCQHTENLSSPTYSETESDTSTEIEYKNYRENVRENVDEVLLEELKASFDFFWETANTIKNSPAYGLIPDRYNTSSKVRSSYASIASVGYGLAMIPVAVEYEWISKEEGQERVEGTLRTLINAERTHGFFYHFLSMNTGKRFNTGIEVSIIDTAILINGCLVAGQYFKGDSERLAKTLYESVEWDWYYDDTLSKFYMGYTPEKGFSGYWDGYAEQLMLFVLASGSPTHPLPKDPYLVMRNLSKKADATPYYGSFYMTWTGSLFTYQFSHAFIDFYHTKDDLGIDWFENSVNASKAAVYYAESLSDKYKTYSDSSWGFTACDGPNGYTGAYGIFPCSGGNYVDGTVPPCGAIGSLVFVPEEAIRAMKHYREDEKLWSQYGFVDAYNLGCQEGFSNPDIANMSKDGWYASDVIGIDKGIGALMIENYISGMIWNITNDIPYYQNGLKVLNIEKY